ALYMPYRIGRFREMLDHVEQNRHFEFLIVFGREIPQRRDFNVEPVLGLSDHGTIEIDAGEIFFPTAPMRQGQKTAVAATDVQELAGNLETLRSLQEPVIANVLVRARIKRIFHIAVKMARLFVPFDEREFFRKLAKDNAAAGAFEYPEFPAENGFAVCFDWFRTGLGRTRGANDKRWHGDQSGKSAALRLGSHA